MPAFTLTMPLATLIGGAISGGTALTSAKMQSSAAKKAGDASTAAAAKSEAFAREQDALDRAAEAQKQARLDVYRNWAQGSLASLAPTAGPTAPRPAGTLATMRPMVMRPGGMAPGMPPPAPPMGTGAVPRRTLRDLQVATA